MPAEKTTALVLKVVDFSESSCVVTLMTRDFGKITALAKGARRLKSPFEGALDILAICRIVFLRKSGDTLDLLTEAKLQRRFRSASRDLSRLYAGCYLIELLKTLTDHHDPHPRVFDLACYCIEQIDGDGDVRIALLRFELCALALLGHRPALEECVNCGNLIPTNGRVPFGFIAGGVLCEGCRAGQRGVMALSSQTVHTAKQFANPEIPWEQLSIPDRCKGELRGLMDQLMSNLLGSRPRMYPYLRQIFR